MPAKPKILLTCDKDIHSPGLKIAYEALKENTELTIIAPSSEKASDFLELKPIPWHDTKAWILDGSAAECLSHFLFTFNKESFNMIISGLNHQSSMGRNIFHSSTLNTMKEGASKDIFSIAFSSEDFSHIEQLKKYIHFIVKHFYAHPPIKGAFANVCFPLGKIKGIKLARQGKGYFLDDDHLTTTTFNPTDWLDSKWIRFEEAEDSDVALLRQGYITAVLLHIKTQNDFALLDRANNSFEDLYEQFAYPFQ